MQYDLYHQIKLQQSSAAKQRDRDGVPPLKQTHAQVIKLRDLPDNNSLMKRRQKSVQTAQIQMRPKNLSGQADAPKLSEPPHLPGIANQSALDKRRQAKHKYMPSQMGPRRQMLNATHMQHGSVNLDGGYPASMTHPDSQLRHQERQTNDRTFSQVTPELPSTTLNIKMDGNAAKVSEFQSNNQVSNSASSRRQRNKFAAGILSPHLVEYVDQPVVQQFKAKKKGIVPPLKLDQHLKVPGTAKVLSSKRARGIQDLPMDYKE